MNYSLYYALTLSLMVAPIAASDCTENTSVVVEVIQPEQEVAQPFYKKALQKLWEHKYKIAAVSAAAIAAVILYRYTNGSVFGLKSTAAVKPTEDVTIVVEKVTTPEGSKLDAIAPKNNNQLNSTATTATTEVKTEQENVVTPVVNVETSKPFYNFVTDSKVWSEASRLVQALKEGPRSKSEATF